MGSYMRTWATPTKLKLFGHHIKKELNTLDPGELNDVIQVLTILTGMVRDEINERSNEPILPRV